MTQLSKRSLIDFEKDLWFGFKGSELSTRMKHNAYRFDEALTDWMLENVGEYGKDWWAELDKEYDSIRAVFKDPSVETWVLMTWANDAD